MMRFLGLCVITMLIISLPARAETLLFKKEVSLCSPISITIPSDCITEADVQSGEIAIYLTAHNRAAGWTVHCRPEALCLTDGQTDAPLLNAPQGEHLGGIPSGRPRRLVFKLPPMAHRQGAVLKISKGLFSMLATPDGPYELEAWKGLRRPEVDFYVDRMNRGVMIDMSSVKEESVKFVYEIPGVMRKESEAPVCFFRMPENLKPFQVHVEILTQKDGIVKTGVEVAPRSSSTLPPTPQDEVLSGICYYGKSLDQYDKFIAEDLGNLLVQWADREPVEVKQPYLERLAERGIRYMGIYRNDSPATIDSYKRIFGANYLHNNIGEYAGYLYQVASSAKAINMPIDQKDMGDARERFLQFINRRVRNEHKRHEYLLSTSGSALADYELMGGIDFMCSELYAVGAANINYATAEMRGAARKWRPEYWGSWLAEEWQTFGVPYESDQKFDLLTVGLYSNYMMGTNVIVLESGASTTQAQEHTFNLSGVAGVAKQLYDDPAPTRYRKAMHDFRQFVKANPRDQGTPETNIAMLRGNLDSWVGAFHGWIPAWAQHDTARKEPRWLMDDPERSWLAAMDVFTPILAGALKPYPNHWIGGMPHGQVDVVGLDEFSRLADLKRYKLAVIPGWNTMTPELMKVLREYVEQGGTLIAALPHFSTRRDREFRHYHVGDLIDGGDLSALIDVKVAGFVEASGVPVASKLGGFENKRFEKETLARVELGDDSEVLATVDDRPYVIAQRRGKGKMVLLLGKEYPGKESVASFYRNLLRKFASELEQLVTVSPLPGKEGDVRAVSFAVYPSRVYFLNADCVTERTVNVTIDGRRQLLNLGPREFLTVERQK